MTFLDPEIERVSAERVRELRGSLKLGQQAFGEILGFSRNGARMRVSEIETGRRPIQRQTALIVLYVEAFGPLTEES